MEHEEAARLERLFYTDGNGRCGDFIPFWHDGTWHLFHIDTRDSSWKHVTTRDLVRFRDHGRAIAAGSPESQDRAIFTGCVVEKDGRFHIFYTGHNADFRRVGLEHMQVVLRAESDDLMTWTKRPGWALPPATEHYGTGGWRDPHVFWNEEAGAYWMVVTGCLADIGNREPGSTALLVSEDLENWEARASIYAPGLFNSHECPDLFRIGDWWYLVFSTYRWQWETRYRMARTPEGPWQVPPDDVLDGRAYYAAKTASDGDRRLLFGWASVKTGDEDAGKYEWGGTLVAHELGQRADGTLRAFMPAEIGAALPGRMALTPEPEQGAWRIAGTTFSADSRDGFSYLHLGELPDPCVVETEIDWEAGSAGFGVMLRATRPMHPQAKWYQVRFDPGRGRFAFDRSSRSWDNFGYVEERPAALDPAAPVSLRIVVSETMFVTYVNDEVALTARGYDLRAGGLGLFVTEGAAAFREVRVRTAGAGSFVKEENAHGAD